METKSPWPVVRKAELLDEIKRHLSQMALHQRDRYTAKLLADVATELERDLRESTEIRGNVHSEG